MLNKNYTNVQDRLRELREKINLKSDGGRFTLVIDVEERLVDSFPSYVILSRHTEWRKLTGETIATKNFCVS